MAVSFIQNSVRDGTYEGLRWEVGPELGADSTAVACAMLVLFIVYLVGRL